jgi:PAS domain S-box-containing protein
VLDASGTTLYASNAWRLLERDSKAAPNCFDNPRQIFDCCRLFGASALRGDSDPTLRDDIQEILSGQKNEFHRKYYYPHLPELRPFVIHAAHLSLPGSTFRVLITHEDLKSGEDFKTNQERLTKLLDNTNVLEWEAERGGQQFTHVTEQASKTLGYPVAAWYQPNFLGSHIHADDRQRVLDTYRKKSRDGEDFEITFRMLRSDGRIVWMRSLASVKDTGGAGRMHGFMIDISERKRAEEALKDVGSRLIAAQEEERKRVARELHDDLNQRMAVLAIEMEQLGQKTQEPLAFRKRLQRLQSEAQEISTVIHRLSYKLHPSKLDHLGLVAAVRSLCEEMSQNDKPKIFFTETDIPTDLPKDVTLCIFRIAQETLRNCVKHSGADSAQVMLTRTDNAICLSVSDNGCGFDTNSDEVHKGLGLISMEERLRIVGGEINLWSQPQRGTRIEVSIPLSRAIESEPTNFGLSQPPAFSRTNIRLETPVPR